MNKGLIYNEPKRLLTEGMPIGYCNGRLAVMEIGRDEANSVIVANHYSHTVARTSYIHLGVFVEDALVGVMQFGYMMNPTLRSKSVEGTGKDQYLEFNRMWVDDRCAVENAESQAVSCAMRYIRHAYPKVKWVQSYADERCGKLGLVYQACSFGYYGRHKSLFWELDGEVYHDILMKVKRGKLYCRKAKYLQDNKKRAVKKSYWQFHYIKFLDRSWEARCRLKKQSYPKYYMTNMKPRLTGIYRAIRTETGKWVYGRLLKISPDVTALTDGNFVACISQESIGQFTGLTDKNGCDIYVGDIVEFLKYEKGCRMPHKGVVIESNDYANYVIVENGVRHDFNFDSASIEVIGNIHDKLLDNEEYPK